MGFRNMYISASAGSGKTYQLVNRFLALLCLQKLERGVDVSRIIAITFTRKAAGEFRERILSALAEGALSPEAAADLWQKRILPTIANPASGILPGQKPALPCSPEIFFRDLLADVMRQFPKLNLGTIDSLFQRMVSALAYELGLSGFQNLSDDKEQSARRKALRNTYRIANSSPELYEAIMGSMADESALSRLDYHLQRMVAEYHKPSLDSVPEAWGDPDGELTEAARIDFDVAREELIPPLSEDVFQENLQRMLEINEACKGPAAINDYINALGSLTATLKAGDSKNWKNFFGNCETAGIDVDAMERTRRAMLWRVLLQRTRALRLLLDSYEQGYQRDVRSHGWFTFDDIPRLLSGHSDADSIARIQERTDAALEHWLLDEFQDTAFNQYNILLDLLQSRAQGEGEGSVLMVGDAKQSIYQFRGGDPRLFINSREHIFGLRQGQNYPEGTEYSAEQQLNVSYRSAQAVLDLSNDLFADIDRTARCATVQVRELWKKLGYGEHRSGAGLAAKLGPGCAQVWQANKLPGGGNDNVYRTIAHLLAQARPKGVNRPGSCAILVRTGNQGTKLADALNELREEYPFEGDLAVCNDKAVGHDSPLGQALLQLFCWLDNPADEKDFGLLRLSPLWQQGISSDTRWTELNATLARGGVSAVLNTLTPSLKEILANNEFLHQRWKTWVDEAAAFDAEGGTLSDWIARIRGVTVREEPQGNVIHIMTIHKAKGLEYDMVILPIFAPNQKMANYRKDKVSLLCRKNEDSSPRALILPPPRDNGVVPGMVAETLAQDWQTDQEFAGFCELYVAVTRAKRATYIVHSHEDKPKEAVDPAKQDGESYRGMMLQLAMEHPGGDLPEGCDSATCTYARGESDWWKHLPSSTDKTEVAPQDRDENYTFATLPRRTPSSMDKDREADAEDDVRHHHTKEGKTLRLQDMGGAGFGTAVHALFEKVAWLEEGQEAVFPPGEDARAVATVQRALATPAIARHFRKPCTPCRLYREQNFEALASGSWISGQIDRLVVEYEGDKPVRARIYDYKTDAEPDPDVLAATYRTQMNAYRRLVSLAFGLPLSAVSVTLLHVSSASEPAAIVV